MHDTILILQRILTPTCLLVAGGAAYYLLEVVVRGWSHWTMAILGGVCLLCIYLMNRALAGHTVLLRALLAALIITALEFAAGCLLNLWLRMAIWDYSDKPCHLLGQVCLPMSVQWYLLSLPVCGLCTLVQRWVLW